MCFLFFVFFPISYGIIFQNIDQARCFAEEFYFNHSKNLELEYVETFHPF